MSSSRRPAPLAGIDGDGAGLMQRVLPCCSLLAAACYPDLVERDSGECSAEPIAVADAELLLGRDVESEVAALEAVTRASWSAWPGELGLGFACPGEPSAVREASEGCAGLRITARCRVALMPPGAVFATVLAGRIDIGETGVATTFSGPVDTVSDALVHLGRDQLGGAEIEAWRAVMAGNTAGGDLSVSATYTHGTDDDTAAGDPADAEVLAGEWTPL